MSTAECVKGLPRTIKIGPYDWSVVLKEGNDSVCYAEIDLNAHTVSLWNESLTSPSHAVGVMMHECLHVIFDVHNLAKMKRDKEEREEAIVAGFEIGLISLFRDNPKFMMWLKKWL